MSVVALRIGAFLGVFLLLFALERVLPRRRHRQAATYLTNLGIFLIDSVLTRLLLVAGGVATAVWAEAQGIGLFGILDAPLWVAVAISLVLLDLSVWAQHVATHKIPLLWRLHEIHHADEQVDVTTGLRFHPLEIVLSLLFKSLTVILLGAPVVAVIAFEIVLNAGAMFSHSNLKLPPRVDRALRLVTVTPDMHRVHHSVHRDEADSNYGFFLPWWDYLFRTYRAQPRDGHQAMALGVRGSPDRRLRTLLARPFVRRVRTTPAR